MNPMSNLLALGQYILAPILSEWISDTDLCGLDCAVCQHSTRGKFLHVLSHCSVVNTTPDRVYYEEMFDWLLMRGIGLKTVSIKSEYAQDVSLKLKLLLSSTRHLSHLTFESESDPMFVNGLGLTVDLLSVEYLEDFNKIAELDLIFFALDLINFISLNDSLFASIVPRCSNLKYLTVPGHVDISSLLDGFAIEKFVCGLISICKVTTSTRICELQRVSYADTATICFGESIYRVTDLEIDNAMGDAGFEFLNNFIDHLQSVNMIQSPFNATPPARLLTSMITRCFNLRKFSASGGGFRENDLIGVFSHSPKLKHIQISCGGVTSAVLQAIATSCKHIEKIILNERNLPEDTVIELFSECPRLVEFGCGKGVLSEALLLHLARNCGTLTLICDLRCYTEILQTSPFVSCSCVKQLTSSGLITLFSQNPTMEKFGLYGIDAFNFETCARLVELCPLLTSISASKCKLVSADCLVALAKCKHLTSLSMEGLEITYSLLEDLLKDKPGFTKLVLPQCRFLGSSGECSAQIAKYCPILRHLDLSNCRELTTSDVLRLLRSCSHLTYLKLFGCNPLSMDIFDVLKTRRMRYVNVKWCGLDIRSQKFLSMNYSCSCEFVYE